MKKNKFPSRRKFLLTTTTAASAFMIVPRHVLGLGFTAPSDKVNIAIVGAGGKGKENTGELLKLDDVQITAIADPANYWDLARFYYKTDAGRGPVKAMIEKHNEGKGIKKKISEYLDFRDLLKKEKNIDAIMCSTPDHTHAYVSLLSMRAGKHVYCEKPLTHNIWEAREISKLTRETGLATQMGNSGHSTDGIRLTVEYIQAGSIGKIKEVHAWVPANRWNPELQGLPKGNSKKPEGFDWDLWIGPREMRDYHDAYTPVTWRDFWDFGCGALGDFGCHDLDAPTWALNLKAPESIEVFPAGFSNQDIAPYGEIGYYQFLSDGDQQPVKITWYSGGLRPPHHEHLPENYILPRRGTLFIGEKGVIINEGGNRNPKIFPENLAQSFTPPTPTLPRSKGHFRDWVDAIKGGPKSSANFDYGARLTEITLLGVLSLRLGGKKIHWDTKQMKALGMPEADPFIRESTRKGWEM